MPAPGNGGTSDQQEVVVVTGASAGLGRAIAHAFGSRGARLGLIARNAERLQDVVEEVRRLGGDALALPLDVCDADAMEAAAQTVEERFGPIDVWVNNAMASVFSPALEMPPDEFRRVTEVTYLGYVHGTLAALKRMVNRNRGTIVQVGSALAYRAIPGQSAYCAAKSAIRGFTYSVRCELMNRNSRVHLTMVQMPALNTPQFSWVRTRLPRKPQPVPPVFQPEVGAEAVVWAAHHRRREVYVGASTLATIWANKMAPALMDRVLARIGIESQQYDGAVTPGRADNLFASPNGNFGTHGEFDAIAHERSGQWWVSAHRGRIALGVAALAGAGYLISRRR